MPEIVVAQPTKPSKPNPKPVAEQDPPPRVRLPISRKSPDHPANRKPETPPTPTPVGEPATDRKE